MDRLRIGVDGVVINEAKPENTNGTIGKEDKSKVSKVGILCNVIMVLVINLISAVATLVGVKRLNWLDYGVCLIPSVALGINIVGYELFRKLNIQINCNIVLAVNAIMLMLTGTKCYRNLYMLAIEVYDIPDYILLLIGLCCSIIIQLSFIMLKRIEEIKNIKKLENKEVEE